MPIWTNTGQKPANLSRTEKRDVIATERGWVKRIKFTDVHSNVQRKDEVLVAIGNLANSSQMGFPTVTDVWHHASSVANGTTVNTWVSFSEPVQHSGLYANLQLTVANTASGNAMVAIANSTVYGADNRVLFRWTPNTAGTYKIEAQTIANNTPGIAANLVSMNTGAEDANLVITGIVSNTGGSITVTV